MTYYLQEISQWISISKAQNNMRRVFFQRNKGSKLILPIKPNKLKNLIKPKIYTQHNKLKDSLIDKDNVKKDK